MVAQPLKITKNNDKQIYDGNKNLLKLFSEHFIIIRRTQLENSDVSHVIRNFVGAPRKRLQSVRQRTTVNFST